MFIKAAGAKLNYLKGIRMWLYNFVQIKNGISSPTIFNKCANYKNIKIFWLEIKKEKTEDKKMFF